MVQKVLITTAPGTPGNEGGDMINDNFTELYGWLGSAALLLDGSTSMTGGFDTDVGTFNSGVAASGTAYTFDTTNAVTGKLQSWLNNTVEQAYIDDDGSIVGLADLTIANQAAIGGTASLGGNASASLAILHVSDTLFITGGGASVPALEFDVEVTGSAAAVRPVGILSTVTIGDVGFAPSATGVRSHIIQDSTRNWVTGAIHASFDAQGVSNVTTGTGAPNNYACFFGEASGWAGGVPTTGYGMILRDQGAAGMTNVFGVCIDKQTGATNNYGLALDDDGVGADLVVGATNKSSYRHGGSNTELANLVGTGYFDVQMGLHSTDEVIAYGNVDVVKFAAMN